MKSDGYQLWFESDNKTKIQLPVNPETFTVKNSANNSGAVVPGLGEITIMNEPSPVQISFSSIFPVGYFSGCSVKKPLPPTIYAMFFSALIKSKKPIRFTAAKFGVVMYVTVESFQYSESGGDVGTYEYSLTLKEYRSTKARQITVKKNTKKATVEKKKSARVNNKSKPKTYTVKSGDCLYNIAKKFYGDGSQYTKIYNANKSVIGSNPNLIKAGQVLTIP
ncbi:MAG: LysM peptidoglycan-binding domain-containing protein [Porcipelethomonas sp.]